MVEKKQEEALEAVLRAEPVEMFQGYDAFSGDARQTVLQGASKTGTEETDSYYRMCTNLSELHQALKISGSVTASFKGGSASAKATFVRDLKITNTCITIVLYKSIKKTQTYTDVSFAKPVKQLSAKDFCSSFGDSFVSSMATGGEYFAAYVFYAQTVAERDSLAVDLKAKYKLPGGHLDGDLQAQLKEARKSIQQSQTLSQKLIGFGGSPPQDEDKIVDFATQLTKDKISDWTVIGYETLGYEHVREAPDLTKVIENRGKLKDLNDKLARLHGLKNQVDWLTQAYECYGYTSDTDPVTKKNQIDADIKALDGLLDKMSKDPTQAYQDPDLKSLSFGLPQLQCVITTEGGWGADGGGVPFDQFPNQTSLHLLNRLTKISMRGGAVVDRLTTTYHSPGGGDYTENRGGDGGTPSKTLDLQPGECITEVQGWIGHQKSYKVVSQLTLKTNNGNTLQWPPNTNAPESPFSWKQGDKDKILLGFAGRSGDLLDQLALKVGTFSPAKWVK